MKRGPGRITKQNKEAKARHNKEKKKDRNQTELKRKATDSKWGLKVMGAERKRFTIDTLGLKRRN